LAARDLLPVLSWFILRGKCRRCKAHISAQYPAVEALCAALFAAVAVYAGEPYISVVPLCLLAFMLLSVSFIDLAIQEIPDGLLIFGASAGIIWIVATLFYPPAGGPEWHDALLGALAGSAPLFLIDRLTILLTGKDGFGFGDVKMMAVCGLFLGWRLTLVSLLFGVVAGGVICAALMIARRVRRGDYIPFGPFLAVGVLCALFFGNMFIDMFFRLGGLM